MKTFPPRLFIRRVFHRVDGYYVGAELCLDFQRWNVQVPEFYCVTRRPGSAEFLALRWHGNYRAERLVTLIDISPPVIRDRLFEINQ